MHLSPSDLCTYSLLLTEASLLSQRPREDQADVVAPDRLVDSVQTAVHSVQRRMQHYDGSLLQVCSLHSSPQTFHKCSGFDPA